MTLYVWVKSTFFAIFAQNFNFLKSKYNQLVNFDILLKLFNSLSLLFHDSFMTLLWLFYDYFMTFSSASKLFVLKMRIICMIFDKENLKFGIGFSSFCEKILWTDYFELQRISKFICYWLVSFIFSGIALVFRDWSASQPSLRASWPSWVVC